MALLNFLHLKTVVAIGASNKKGKFICNATGFLIGFLAKNSKNPTKRAYYIFLLTNRHVFENQDGVHLRFNTSDGKSKVIPQALKFPNKELRWLAHPNKKVDFALLNVNPQALTENAIDYVFFNEESFAYQRSFEKIGIAVGDEVYILGFPMGFAGGAQNFPYAKSGIISRFDKELLRERKAFLVDSSIFPGNSGGPAILKPTNTALNNTKAVTTPLLLGAVSGYLPYEEKLWSHQTNPPTVVSLEREHSGLSFVVPMDFAKQIFNRWLKNKKRLEKAQEQKSEQPAPPEVKTAK
ncbi:MAG: serine protease [Patescibacteria group bacterium]